MITSWCTPTPLPTAQADPVYHFNQMISTSTFIHCNAIQSGCTIKQDNVSISNGLQGTTVDNCQCQSGSMHSIVIQ